jgi:hypothetical protein
MNPTSYIPGQSLFNVISEYIAEAPSPAPAPVEPVEPSAPPEPSKPVVTAEPVNSINLVDENDKLKEEVKSLKQEVKVLKNVCGLDRRLKITKIEEEDLHKYYQYDLKKYTDEKRHDLHRPQEYDFGIINKTDFILEPSQKNYDRKNHGYGFPAKFPRNTCMLYSIKVTPQYHPQIGSWTDGVCKATFGPGGSQYIMGGPGDDLASGFPTFDSRRMGDINEYYVMNITFPKLPDFMKIENMNTIDIDIYKMKGIYVITYE